MDLLKKRQLPSGSSPQESSTIGESENPIDDTLLRLAEVQKMVPVSRSTIWRLIRAGQFPAPIRITSNAVAWRRRDVLRYVDSRANLTHQQEAK